MVLLSGVGQVHPRGREHSGQSRSRSFREVRLSAFSAVAVAPVCGRGGAKVTENHRPLLAALPNWYKSKG